MAKTRVIYKQAPNGKFTTEGLVAGDDIVVATYDPQTLEYSISSVATEAVVFTGKSVSPTMLKKNIKKALRNLGVYFQDEVRQARIIS